MAVVKGCAGGCGECPSCIARHKHYMENTTWLERNAIWLAGVALILFLLAVTNLHCEPVKISFVGDINFTDDVAQSIDQNGTTWPLDKIKPILAKSDFRVANLESPEGFGGAKYCPKTYYFKAKPKYLDVLKDAKFDLVSLANNHCLDYGPSVILQTEKELDARGIQHMGILHNASEENKPVIVKIKGYTFGFLAYCNVCPEEFAAGTNTAGVSVGTYALVAKQIKQLRSKVDFVIVFPHWGTEYYAADKNQKKLAKIMLAAGADAVVGAHPHVLQQVYQPDPTHVIAYSMGNFLFPMHWQVAEDSAILTLTFDKENGQNTMDVAWTDITLRGRRPLPVDPSHSVGEANIALRDTYIIHTGYQYDNNRRWPSNPPWTTVEK
jgi:hypothetical protein